MYDEQFYSDVRESSRVSAGVVVPLVMELVRPRSVVDVGCGTGSWLAAFRAAGVPDVLGIDADTVPPEMFDISIDEFEVHDLTEPLAVGRRFDLVICLEVAEHLRETSADDLVRSLTELAGVVLFSAATPHQGGAHHVNEQWPGYWAEIFSRQGYLSVDCLRRRLWDNPEVAWWFAQNLLIYVDGGAIDQYPALAATLGCWGGPPPALVHPRRFLEWVEWGIAQAER